MNIFTNSFVIINFQNTERWNYSWITLSQIIMKLGFSQWFFFIHFWLCWFVVFRNKQNFCDNVAYNMIWKQRVCPPLIGLKFINNVLDFKNTDYNLDIHE